MAAFIPFANNRLAIWLQILAISPERVIVTVNKVVFYQLAWQHRPDVCAYRPTGSLKCPVFHTFPNDKGINNRDDHNDTATTPASSITTSEFGLNRYTAQLAALTPTTDANTAITSMRLCIFTQFCTAPR
jgi:hypothetical protein